MSEPASEERRTLTIVNQRGLHARASAKFVAAVAALPDRVRLVVAIFVPRRSSTLTKRFLDARRKQKSSRMSPVTDAMVLAARPAHC